MKTNLSTYIDDAFRKKTIVLVGNAQLDSDYSEQVDRRDIVVRFNHLDNYNNGIAGEKFTHWSVNHHTSEGNHGIKRSDICEIVRRASIPVITPFSTSWSKDLDECVNYYRENRIDLVYPDAELIEPKGKQPRTGFYLLTYLIRLCYRFSVIGFTPKGRGRCHDTEREYSFILEHQHLIEIIDRGT